MTLRAWFLMIITFPGVVIHEIAHRFFCDFYDIPVYKIIYFTPFFETSGCVLHATTDRFRHAFFISMGPLIINSIVCMILTFPYGMESITHTESIFPRSELAKYLYGFTSWIGISAGWHAVPSKQDLQCIINLPKTNNKTYLSRIALLLVNLFSIMDIPIIGSFAYICFVAFLFVILPLVYVNLVNLF